MPKKYSVVNKNIENIIGLIRNDQIAIPEIQRPFVWKKSQVRDLIDSLYNGYPTGYLIMWNNPDVKIKNGGTSTGKQILIDGQQRVTSLMAAICGMEIVNENFQKDRIKISFNPLAKDDEKRFDVQNPTYLKDKRWIPDISIVFANDFSNRRFINEYCKNNNQVGNEDFAEKIDKALTQLVGILNSDIGIIELGRDLDIDVVSEIFIRINSQGKSLNSSDFAMSKIASDSNYNGNMLRKIIDYFCKLANNPSFYDILEKDVEFKETGFFDKIKWIYKYKGEPIYIPDYGDILRVAFMHKFGRRKLADLVSLLSGRNFETREYEDVIAADSFEQLKDGIIDYINDYNFKNFITAIVAAGFITKRLVRSQNSLNFAYTLYLMLSNDKSIDKGSIKSYIQKWFVLSLLTSRYTNSPESAMDSDMRSIKSKGFIRHFKDIESSLLTDSYWDVTLVQNLETSASNSPYYSVYLAAQIHNNENSLFMIGQLVSHMITILGDIHHIFPKEYLKANGITEKSKYNQIANYVYLDKTLNILIKNNSPKEYFTNVLKHCENRERDFGNLPNKEGFYKNLKENSIPEDIMEMEFSDYDKFLEERRKMMAKKIKEYYESL